MRSFRWIVGMCVVVGLLAASLARAQALKDVDITGYYAEQDGEFTKISKVGDVYQYLQHTKGGDWLGVAIRDGDSLSIGWQRSDRANLGVSVYKIEKGDKGPTLTGGWAAYPGGGIVKDSLTWSRKVD
jgi:hypothetical protein